jgi:hypothetical protein
MQKASYFIPVLGLYLLTGVAAAAGEAVQYPVAIPSGCFALAEREATVFNRS